jgi:5-methylcytosine-specific restriction enzyme B
MARLRDRNSEAAYGLVRRMLTEVMPGGGSILEPSAAVWIQKTADDAAAAFVDNPGSGAQGYLPRLREQLRDQAPTVIRLVAELQVPCYLIHTSVSLKLKLEKISEVLAIGGLEDVSVPDGVKAALERGFCNVGRFLQANPQVLLEWHLRFAQTWIDLDEDERQHALDDPWTFEGLTETITAKVPSSIGAAMAWRHLTHPDSYDPIVSQNDRRSILDRWPSLHTAEDPDQALLETRRALEPRWGEDFSWYDLPERDFWKPTTRWKTFVGWAEKVSSAVDLDTRERDFKLGLAAEFETPRRLLLDGKPDWVESFVTVWKRTTGLVNWRRADAFGNWVRADPGQASELLSRIWSGEEPNVTAALNLWPNALTSNRGHQLDVVGVLLMSRDPENSPPLRVTPLTTAFQLAGWGKQDQAGTEELIGVAADLFESLVHDSQAWLHPLRDPLDAQGLIWFLADEKSPKPDPWDDSMWREFLGFRGATSPDLEEDEEETTDHLQHAAKVCSVDVAYLREVAERLKRKRQVVFYGPPGTGKTYVARQLALAIAEGRPENVTTVQFHPSTSYEDFIEGIRPELGEDKTLSYHVVKGPLMRVAENADANSHQTYVLLIDELNRANLPKVFGELLYLLEYRGDDEAGVSLLYRPGEKFKLPTNLYLVGTMNTADRSIALVDAALRRRFEFFGFFPDRPPVDAMLRTWVKAKQPNLRVDRFLDAVNAELHNLIGRELLIGPSYFMDREGAAGSLDSLGKTWTHNVYPTLEELLWGQPDDRARWTWEEVSERFSEQLGVNPPSDPDSEPIAQPGGEAADAAPTIETPDPT